MLCELKLHLYWFSFLFFANLKKLSLLKPQYAGHNVSWKNFQFGVEVADIAIVKTTRGLDFVFSVG